MKIWVVRSMEKTKTLKCRKGFFGYKIVRFDVLITETANFEIDFALLDIVAPYINAILYSYYVTQD